MATRTPAYRNLLIVLVMIPFWSNFLVRTYAWRVLLGTEGPLSQLSQALGGEPIRVLFTNTAVLIGLVYGFLPFMVLPLFAALDRMDWSLIEAGRDLYASGWTAFRKITFPLSMPGVIARTASAIRGVRKRLRNSSPTRAPARPDWVSARTA